MELQGGLATGLLAQVGQKTGRQKGRGWPAVHWNPRGSGGRPFGPLGPKRFYMCISIDILLFFEHFANFRRCRTASPYAERIHSRASISPLLWKTSPKERAERVNLLRPIN